VVPALIDTVTSPCRFVPAIAAGKIAWPERPGPALIGPNRINPASFFVAGSFEKYTVFAVRVFDYAAAQADAFEIFAANIGERDFEIVGDKLYFGPSYPDIAFARPGAAPATAATGEV